MKNPCTYRVANMIGRVRKARISLPYIGMDDSGNSTRNWAHMTMDRLEGQLCPRQVKKAIRGWVKHSLGRSISPEELRMAMKRVEYCVA